MQVKGILHKRVISMSLISMLIVKLVMQAFTDQYNCKLG